MDALTIGLCIGSLVVGGLVTWLLMTTAFKKRSTKIIREAEAEAEVIKKDKILQAKEKFLAIKAENEKEINARNAKMAQAENKLRQKETQLKDRYDELQKKQRNIDVAQEELDRQKEQVVKKQEDVDKVYKQQIEKLEQISGLSSEQAKESLVESLKAEARTEAMSYINDIMDEAKINANKEAKKIVLQTIQRVATETAIENSVTIFHIDSDEIKGRIIGREGRNIRALEAATGVEIIVDDTPEAIVLSAFDPMRREIARLALHPVSYTHLTLPTKA